MSYREPCPVCCSFTDDRGRCQNPRCGEKGLLPPQVVDAPQDAPRPETGEVVAWGVTQTITGDDGNCLEAAIATVTGIPLDEFPLDLLGHPETHPRWFSRLRDWLYFHDWTMDEVYGDPPSGLHVAVGPSPRKAGSHAVVVLNGHYVFDPHPSRAFFGAGEAKYYITLDRRVRHPLPPLAASPATDERLDDRALEAAMRTLVTGLDRGTVWFNLLPECIRAYLSAHPATQDAQRQGEALPTPPAVTAEDALDARRWRFFRERVWVGTGEDDEVVCWMVFGQREDVDGLAESDRRKMHDGALDQRDMPLVCDSLIDAALSAPQDATPSGEGTNG